MDNAPGIPVDLKPISLSELLDRTFTLYRNHFWLFCGMMALPEAVGALFGILFVTSSTGRGLAAPPPPVNPQDPFAALAALGPSLLGVFALLIIRIVLYAIVLGAVTITVSELYLGRRASIIDSYKRLRGRTAGLIGLIFLLLLIAFGFLFAGMMGAGIIGALLGGGLAVVFKSPIVVAVVVLLAVFAGMFVGVGLMVRFSVSIPVFMLERTGVSDSLARSGTLTRDHRWRILGAIMVMYVVVYAVQFLFSAPFVIATFVTRAAKGVVPVWTQIGTAVAGAIGGTLAGPLLMITLALIYYDVRIRKEAFDLEAMMAALGPPGNAPTEPGPPPTPWQPAP